jgi:carbonic anhydrase
MIQLSILVIVITLTLLKLSASAYVLNNPSCLINSGQQSPININLENTIYFDEKYFRFLTNNYDMLTEENKWTYFENEKAVGIAPLGGNQTDFGSFIFVRDWAMYSYKLQKILFRTPSEHTIDNERFDIEMQLIHTIDGNYYPPGRRIDLQGVDHLVISLLFKVTSDDNPAKSLLFKFMNLESGINGKISRPIKLHHIIQHQPSYLYSGTLTYPECQKSLWLVFSQYHFIGQTDFNNLKNMITIATGTAENRRDMFSNTYDVEIFRNWNDKTNLIAKPTLMVYNSSSMMNLSYTLLMSMIFMIVLIVF